jgi:hypothetical protein
MHRRLLPVAAALLATSAIAAPGPALAGAAPPVPGGEIGTLELGRYACELPGDAGGAPGRRVAGAEFTVVTSSSYRSGGRIGSYLMTGDRLVMTSGPRKGERYHRISPDFLRRIAANGADSELRCIREGRHHG